MLLSNKAGMQHFRHHLICELTGSCSIFFKEGRVEGEEGRPMENGLCWML
jgi:hypothetical protein